MKHFLSVIILILFLAHTPLRASEWQVVSEMPVPVSGAVAFVYDSSIYIFGGHYSRTFVTPPIMQVYNPVENSWRLDTLGTIQQARYGANGVMWQGTAYFFGGQTDSVTTNLDVISLLEDNTELALSNTNDNFNRYFASSEVYKGKIYCFGGYSANTGSIDRRPLPYIFIYDLATHKIETEIKSDFTTELPYYQMTARIDNIIYVLGGTFNGVLNTVSTFDTDAKILQPMDGKLAYARYGGTAHALGDSAIMLIGGWGARDQALNTIEIFHLKNEAAVSNTETVPLHHARAEHVSVKFNQAIYVFGGRGTNNTRDIKEVEKYDLGMITDLKENRLAQPVFRLYDNYPNPFNPATEISYQLSRAGRVSLDIYDITGRFVSTLVDDIQPAGAHKISFNAGSLVSGVYFYTLTSAGQSQTKRMLLLK